MGGPARFLRFRWCASGWDIKKQAKQLSGNSPGNFLKSQDLETITGSLAPALSSLETETLVLRRRFGGGWSIVFGFSVYCAFPLDDEALLDEGPAQPDAPTAEDEELDAGPAFLARSTRLHI